MKKYSFTEWLGCFIFCGLLFAFFIGLMVGLVDIGWMAWEHRGPVVAFDMDSRDHFDIKVLHNQYYYTRDTSAGKVEIQAQSDKTFSITCENNLGEVNTKTAKLEGYSYKLNWTIEPGLCYTDGSHIQVVMTASDTPEFKVLKGLSAQGARQDLWFCLLLGFVFGFFISFDVVKAE